MRIGLSFHLALLFVSGIFLSACVNTKSAVYFRDIQNSEFDNPPINFEYPIQKNDILSIYVSSLNPEASAIFNTGILVGTVGINNPQIGYLVNSDGYIQFPMLGQIKVEGLTKKELIQDITKRIMDKKLLLDPIVAIRKLNFHVTVLGEVARPNLIEVPSEKINIMEAIGLAGDLTVYAKRDNILLIREENGKKMIKRLNLNSSEILKSPYYYLKSNDIVYVEPNKSKISSASNARQTLPIILSGLSFLAIIIDRVFIK